MSTPEEMRHWTRQHLYQQVQRMLPDGWTFDLAVSDYCFRSIIKDANGSEVWCNTGYDARILLLDTYGWLLLHDKKPSSEVWQRRKDARPVYGIGPVTIPIQPTPDPEDLDPREVESVYRGPRKV